MEEGTSVLYFPGHALLAALLFQIYFKVNLYFVKIQIYRCAKRFFFFSSLGLKGDANDSRRAK